MKAFCLFESSLTMMRQLNFKAVSNFALLSLALLVNSAPVNAAVYNFSFSNVTGDGAVNGTVSGTITLPDGDGTGLAATSLFVTSAPAALGYTTPFNVFAAMPGSFANSFAVSGGQINKATSVFARQSPNNLFTLNFSTLGSMLTPIGAANPLAGVRDASDTTLTYGATSVPIPGTLALLGLGLAGIGAARRKQA